MASHVNQRNVGQRLLCLSRTRIQPGSGLVQVRGITSNRNPQVGLAGGVLQANDPKSEILVLPRGLEPLFPP